MPRGPSFTRSSLETVPGRASGRGADDNPSRGEKRGIQIIPVGISLFDQPDLPGSIPVLQSLLASDRLTDIAELFKIDEPENLVAFGESVGCALAMLPDAPAKIVGHADIQRAAEFACQDVDKERLVLPHS